MDKKDFLDKYGGGIKLDIGCGWSKMRGFVGLDKKKWKGVDIVHDLEVFPYPIPDDVCISVIATQIVEHIKPWLFIDFMNELWRITKPLGQAAFVHPYGVNELYLQDPTHTHAMIQTTWQYFDPHYPMYDIYEPSPWIIQQGFPTYQTTGMMEVIMHKPTPEELKKVVPYEDPQRKDALKRKRLGYKDHI